MEPGLTLPGNVCRHIRKIGLTKINVNRCFEKEGKGESKRIIRNPRKLNS